eukprot:gene2647-3053_t
MSRRGTPTRLRREEVLSSSSEEESSDYESEESEDEAPRRGAGRGTPRKPKVTANEVDSDEMDKLVDEFVRYIVFVDRKKHPITRADVVSKVLANYKDKKIITAVFERGKAKLRDVFGYDLVNVKKETLSGEVSNEKGKDGKPLPSTTYFLKNTLPLALLNKITDIHKITNRETETYYNNKAFLVIILSAILLESGFIESDVLYEKLQRLDFEVERQHPVFGEWEKTIDQFVKEMYLSKKKDTKNDKPISVYRFGQRSLTETSRRSILEAISEIYGVVDSLLLHGVVILEDTTNNTCLVLRLDSTV